MINRDRATILLIEEDDAARTFVERSYALVANR
jgi:hypothetical protein